MAGEKTGFAKVGVLAAILALAIASTGCGSGAGTTAQPGGPVNLAVTTDPNSAATALITSAGGSLTTTAADGTVFTLAFPAGAVRGDATITLTPVRRIDGLPFSGGLVGAVQMVPEGLRLYQAATLTIESSRTAAADGFETVAFAYFADGEDMYLSPAEVSRNVLALEVWHFSGAGAAHGTPGEIASQQRNTPSDSEAAFTQKMQESIVRHRNAEIQGAADDDHTDFNEELERQLKEAFEKFVRPELEIALADCSKAPEIIARSMGVARQLTLLGGAENNTYQAQIDEINDMIEKIREACARSFAVDARFSAYHLTGTICALDKPFTLKAAAVLDGVAASGEFNFTPADDSHGVWTYQGSMQGISYDASSTYLVDKGADGTRSIVLDPGANWTADMPFVGRNPLGEGVHLGTEPGQIPLEVATEQCPEP